MASPKKGVGAVAQFFGLKAKEMLAEWKPLSDDDKAWFIAECEKAVAEDN